MLEDLHCSTILNSGAYGNKRTKKIGNGRDIENMGRDMMINTEAVYRERGQNGER